MPLFSPVDRAAAFTRLDPAVKIISSTINRLPTGVRDAMHGVWLGHPLHPVVAQVPVGAWLGTAVLDAVAVGSPPGPARRAAERSARTLLTAGLLSVPVAALPGATDWARLHPEQQRIGVLHASTNVVATALQAASLLQRRRGRPGGRLLGLLGVSIAGLAAGIGGHLAYRHAAGANHAEDVPHRTSAQWFPVDRLDFLPDRTPELRMLGVTPVVVVRRGDDVTVLADACSHLGGPLSDGGLDGDCIVCPWHGSTFRLADGSVRHGPATAPQPGFDVRVVEGLVEARVRQPEQDAGRRHLGELM